MQYRVKISEEPEIFKVRVTNVPKAKTGYQVDGSLANDLSAFGGGNLKLTEPKSVERTTITKVPREEANLEAEGGETVLTFDPSGYPLFYEIKGPRHSQNGVPLNLPDDSFIFSDTKSMMIKDPMILKMFNKPLKKGGYTPADLSKQFLSLNKYRGILEDPTSDKIAVETAQLMIKKAVSKLGALALAQEAKKGFPQGIPVVAQAYMKENNLSEKDFLPDAEQAPEGQGQPMEQGMEQPAPAPAPEMQGQQPTMSDGSPVAMPEAAPQPGMRYGGMTQYAEGGMADVMAEITETVRASMEGGIPMDDIILSLIQNKIAVDDIQQVLMNLNIPERTAQEMVLKALSQYQQNAQQQQQQMAAQQQQMAPQGMPQGMPQDMPQQMPQQGQPGMDPAMAQMAATQAMQGAPMAMYGMQLGGYEMPFDPNEMAYGGVARFAPGGPTKETVKGKKGDVEAQRAKDKAAFESNKGTETTTASGKKAKYTYQEGQVIDKADVQNAEQRRAQGKGGGGGNYTKEDVCAWMQKKGGKYYGWTAEEIVAGNIASAENLGFLKGCEVKGQDELEEAIYYEEPIVPGDGGGDGGGGREEDECFCVDPVTKVETIVPCGTDCQTWEQTQTQTQTQGTPQFEGMQYLPEDQFDLAVAMGRRNVNLPPVMGKAPGVRQNIWGTDYMGQAELLKGQTRGTQDALRKIAGNNPGGVMAAMFNAERAGQDNIINLASQTNAANAEKAGSINATNTGHQWNQLLLGKEAQEKYNPAQATWAHNVAEDSNNYWANVANKYGKMKTHGRELAALNQGQGMKWVVGPNGQEGYVNTNNTEVKPIAPTKTVLDLMSDYKQQGLTDNADVLRAIDLQMRMDKSKRLGGNIYSQGGFVLGDHIFPFAFY